MGANYSKRIRLYAVLTRFLTIIPALVFLFLGGCSEDESPTKTTLYSISGKVQVTWIMRNEVGEEVGTSVEDTISGIKVYLTNQFPGALDSTTTVAGTYEFAYVAKGFYQIAALKAPGVLQSTNIFQVGGADLSISKDAQLGPSGGIPVYPNPFNVSMIIPHNLPTNTNVTLDIYSIDGQRIKRLVQQTLNAGPYNWAWNGRDDNQMPVPAGMYWSVLKTDYSVETELIVYSGSGP